uniref:Uncharacterized protein n=1 Tax=Fagus sylvatica TaxID=28930 RepID=A0A2N9IU88_FAGSY
MVRSQSDGSEPPSPPLSSITFRFTFQSSDLGLVWGRFVGGFGWLEPPTDSLSFVNMTWLFQ